MAYTHAVLGESEAATKSAVEWGLRSVQNEEKVNEIKKNIKERLTPLILSSAKKEKTS